MTKNYPIRHMTDEAKEFIAKNSSLTVDTLRKMVKEEFNVDVSYSTIQIYVKRARDAALMNTDAISASVEEMIADHISHNIDQYLGLMDTNIRRLGAIMDGTDPDYEIPNDKENSDKKSIYWFLRLSHTLGEQVERVLSLRPESMELKVTREDIPAIEKYANLSDEELEALLFLEAKASGKVPADSRFEAGATLDISKEGEGEAAKISIRPKD